MRVVWVYGCLPAIMFNSRWLPRHLISLTLGFVIYLRPEYWHTNWLIVHELTHTRQFYRSFGLYGILYLFPKFRLEYECEAYAAEIKAMPVKLENSLIEVYVNILQRDYHLPYSKLVISKCLRSYL